MSVCQREGTLGDDDSADMDGESGRGFEEYEWAGQKRIRATALLEGGFRGKNRRKYKPLLLFPDSSWLRWPCCHGCSLLCGHGGQERCVFGSPHQSRPRNQCGQF